MSQVHCPACGVSVPGSARFCPECGLSQDAPSRHPTIAEPRRGGHVPPLPATPPPPRDTSAATGCGLSPGTLVGDRFRIVSLLGRGGMGVVYRADDLKLGQPVALKVLPDSVARDPTRLAALHDEVRIARSVSHPSVCRVFDIGEADGVTFLCMEYVDGEDLASLLRRIGRLPAAKVLELAHQLSAGLAAAHDRGVIHRDLKPANVMVDGHGQARITDFGLALAGRDDPRAAEPAGTPAYMAPEQLAGEPATFSSDLFALGLVLYEAATGHHAFRATTIAQLREAHATGASAPSTRASDLDPALESAILRCLEAAPSSRPASAREMAHLLPGGDPLLAALEAGRTPSPEMVAAAGGAGTLQLGAAWALLGGVVLALAVGAWAAQRSAPHATALPPKSPEVLLDRSRELVARLSLPTNPIDDILFLTPVRRAPASAAGRSGPARGGSFVPPASLVAVYRQSPRFLLPRRASRTPTEDDPPNDVPGMVSLQLGPEGRLLGLLYVPGPEDAVARGTSDPWSVLLAESGLDPGTLVPVTPRKLPPVPFDRRAEWSLPPTREDAGDGLEVTAAALGGRPVFFEVRGSFSEPGSPWVTWPLAPRSFALGLGFTILTVVLWVGGAVFARRNLRLGRADRRGAFRIAGFFFVTGLATLLLEIHWVPDARSAFFSLVRLPAAIVLMQAFGVWLLYLAVEPYFRSRWPRLFVSWNRLVAGQVRDPLVGRDVLGGVLGGAALAATLRAAATYPGTAPVVERRASGGELSLLLGMGPLLGHILDVLSTGVVFVLPGLLLFLAVHVLVRRTPAALVITVALNGVCLSWLFGLPLPASLVLSAVSLAPLIRFGVLLLCFVSSTSILLLSLPGPISGPAWLVRPTLLGMAVPIVLALWGARTALGSRPLFGTPDL